MNLLGIIVKNALSIRKKFERGTNLSPFKQQHKQLLKLLKSAQFTEFGTHYHFNSILENKKNATELFRKNVPVFTYNKIFNEWWHKTLDGQEDVCWYGKVKYFALSSGTSESASKRIPVTSDMVKTITRTSTRQALALTDFDLPDETFWKGALLIGGSTKLTFKHKYYEGDLSGISAKNRPLWFQRYYKPGSKIAKQKNWDKKLEQIIESAPKWDIGLIVGIPSWVQLLLERIIERYHLNTIHDLWPNLNLYIHSGVAFEPYKKSFEKLFGKKVQFMESYLSSEGFFAFQTRPEQGSMTMVLNGGIFFEFIPFDENHFDENGELTNSSQTFLINEVKENVDYALLISTVAGTWRYLIGDVIKFTNVEKCEIVITGRTKHFLSITGEHLSVENMSAALSKIADEFNVELNEYAVCAEEHGNQFAHRWFIGCDKPIDKQLLKTKLDEHLCELNDDYATERTSALKDIFIEIIPNNLFLDFLKHEGKVGAQIKFPRVLKGEQLNRWKKFIELHIS
jgi:GH3 auxin-responsive promoter